MTKNLELLFFAAFTIGFIVSLALLIQIFFKRNSSFFLGLVVLIFSLELLFSWGTYSGYNNEEGAFPIWILLNYNLVPPALLLYIMFQLDPGFKLRKWHILLFLPLVLEISIQSFGRINGISLQNETYWVLLTEYLPVLGFVFVLTFFWIQFAKKRNMEKGLQRNRFLVLMICFTLICLFWVIFSFVGWEYYYLLELIMVFTLFVLVFLNFMETQSQEKAAKTTAQDFSMYNHKESLLKLRTAIKKDQLYLSPNIALKEVAGRVGLPIRYVSFLINNNLNKNYKEYMNDFRIEAFLTKAKSGEEDHKTLLAIALDSGFSSKSTFNLVFQKRYGKSPSEYLKDSK